MDKINISSQLLERYHRGLCNAEEIRVIEYWLDGAPGEFVETSPSIQTMTAGQEIWKRLESDTLKNTNNPFSLNWLNAAAACILILLTLSIYTTYPKISKSFAHQNSEKIIHKRVNDLLLTTLANDPINFGNSDGGGAIQFGQAMLIRNEGTEDVNLSIQPISSHENAPRKYLCKKGVSYVVVRLSKLEAAETGQELLLLEQDTLWTIPPVRAISDFYRQLNELERMNHS